MLSPSSEKPQCPSCPKATAPGPSLELAGQACWWDPTLGPGCPSLLAKAGYTTASVDAIQELRSHGAA